jgi:hypothetical protein
MWLPMNRHGRYGGQAVQSRRRLVRVMWPVLAACVVLTPTLSMTYGQAPGQGVSFDRPYLSPEANRPPDANQQMAMRDQQGKKANFAAANVERKRQIADDSARLLKLATDLKTEVDKTSKDTLSLGVIRKAEEIEKLARSVKEKMKLTMSAN